MIRIEKNFDEYIEQLETGNGDSRLNFDYPINKDGMYSLVNTFEIREQALVLKNDLIFPHPLLRKKGNGNFDDILTTFKDHVINRRNSVNIRLDPFLIKSISEYNDVLEHDSWFGPQFSNDILDNEQKFSQTIHTTIDDGKQFMDYPVKYTIFRPLWLDKDNNIVQYYIEELLLPKDEEKNFSLCSVPYCSDRYVAQKFIHFTYDRNNKFFEHIDGSVRIFKSEHYKKIYNDVQSGNIYNQHIDGVERYKLFKVEGKLSFNDISILLKSFLRNNPHVIEYFDNK